MSKQLEDLIAKLNELLPICTCNHRFCSTCMKQNEIAVLLERLRQE